MSYRIHIDIPINASDLTEAQREAIRILSTLGLSDSGSTDGLEVNYRLGHDDDRQRSNYLDMDENGHCSHRKTRIRI